MQLSPDIFALRTLGDTVLIGPRAAFGEGHRHAAESDEAVSTRLNAARRDPGALDRLRRAFERWRRGDGFAYTSDRALIDRIAADTRRGRLACFVVPNGEVRYFDRPDKARAALKLMDFKARGIDPLRATAHRLTPTSAATARHRGLAAADLLRPAGAARPAPIAGPSGPGIPPMPGSPSATPATGGGGKAPNVLPLNVGAMGIEHRLAEILHRAVESDRLGDPDVRALTALLDPERIADTISILVLWTAARTLGVPTLLDCLMFTEGRELSAASFLEATTALHDALAGASRALNESDLDEAADRLARMAAILGPDALEAMMRRRLVLGTSGQPAPLSLGRLDRRDEEPLPTRAPSRPTPPRPTPSSPPALPKKPAAPAANAAAAGKAAAAGAAQSAASAAKGAAASAADKAASAKDQAIAAAKEQAKKVVGDPCGPLAAALDKANAEKGKIEQIMKEASQRRDAATATGKAAAGREWSRTDREEVRKAEAALKEAEDAWNSLQKRLRQAEAALAKCRAVSG